MAQALLKGDAVHFLQEFLLLLEDGQIPGACIVRHTLAAFLPKLFLFFQIVVVDQTDTSEGPGQQLPLCPVRIDPKYKCPIRHIPLLRTYVLIPLCTL